MYAVEIQSPFTYEPDHFEVATKEEAIQLYNKIDWADLWKQIEATGSSQASDYYYYSITQKNSFAEDIQLIISGSVETDCVSVCYCRPKTVTKRFLFKSKEVVEPRYQTDMEDVPLPFASQCLTAFMNKDDLFLENEIINQRNPRWD
jgi:hypothetical protein